MIELTRAHIIDAKTMPSVVSENIYPINDHSHPYYLIVVSKIQDKAKISIYPVKNDKILKVVINGTSLDMLTTNFLPNIFLDNSIHISGIIKIKSTLVYEIYIAANYETRAKISDHLRKIRNLNGINLVHEQWLRVDEKFQR